MTQQPISVCYGMGVDSTAVLVGLYRRGIRPDLITFADTGAEKSDTYLFCPIMQEWLRDVGFPKVTVCRYVPKRAPYDSLVGNCEANETLPSLAFGMKSCSLKWKRDAQEPLRRHSAVLQAAWEVGVKTRKIIGFDASERRRTYAAAGAKDQDLYDMWYPLQDWGWDRERCKREIAAVGLPVPIKSACFMCPAMKQIEILQLQSRDPEQYKKAIEIEQRYRDGKHWRFRCQVCDTLFKREDLSKRSAADMDYCPKCYSHDIADASSTVGLGRKFAWSDQAQAV